MKKRVNPLFQQLTHVPKPGQWMPVLTAGLLIGLLSILASICLAALVFSGDLSGYLSSGISFFLFGTCIIGIVAALTTSVPRALITPQYIPAAILSVMAAAITSRMAGSASQEVIFLTVVTTVMITSFLTGAFFLTLGTFKWGNLIRFIPYPVIGGFLAGSGLLVVKGALGFMVGRQIDLLNIMTLGERGQIIKWLPGLIMGGIMLVLLRRYKHYLVMPSLVVGTIVLFYLFLFASHSSLADVADKGWLLGPFSEELTWQPLSFTALGRVDWTTLMSQAGNVGTILIISVVSLLLNASGLEIISRKQIDLNRELKAAGFSNLIASYGGAPVGFHAMNRSTVALQMGTNSRLVGLIAALTCGSVLLLGTSFISYFPKPVLGGLLLYIGFSILTRWLYDSWFTQPKADCFIIGIIVLVIAILGVLEGVAAGIIVASVLFVVNYSRIKVVKHTMSGRSFHSNVQRNLQYQRFIQEHGEQIYILKLQGFIFFGTANSLYEKVKEKVTATGLAPTSFVILDFKLVSGLDSSALHSFANMRYLEEKHNFTLVLTHLSARLQRQFERSGFDAGSRTELKVFPDLDHGVEWCENQILWRDKLSLTVALENKKGTEFLESIMSDVMQMDKHHISFSDFKKSISTYMESQKVSQGTHLIRQGSPPVGVYIIESGQVTTQVETEEGTIIRLRTMNAGTVVGELGAYLGQPATASVIANRDCTLLFLSVTNLRRMEKDNPQTAATFHKFIACVLGERLANSNQIVQALMD